MKVYNYLAKLFVVVNYGADHKDVTDSTFMALWFKDTSDNDEPDLFVRKARSGLWSLSCINGKFRVTGLNDQQIKERCKRVALAGLATDKVM